MKCMFFLITLAVCLTACDRQPSPSFSSDAEVHKKLVGTWREENGKRYCIWVFDSNGNYGAQSDGIRNVTEEGTWIVKDRILKETRTKSNRTDAVLPSIARYIIVRLDDRELVMRLEERPEIAVVYRKEMK